METSWTRKTCMDFTEALASKTPVPGGGAAAALAGALGVALGEMAGRYTQSRKAEQEDSSLNELLAHARSLRAIWLGLVDQDAEGFLPLQRAYALPAEDPHRADVREKAAIAACAAPLAMVRAAGETLEVLEALEAQTRPIFLSDIGCATLFCRAALEAAAMNVFINTRTMQARSKAEAMEAEVQAYRRRGNALAEVLLARIQDRLGMGKYDASASSPS